MRKKGFTLIEVVITLSIISTILISITKTIVTQTNKYKKYIYSSQVNSSSKATINIIERLTKNRANVEVNVEVNKRTSDEQINRDNIKNIVITYCDDKENDKHFTKDLNKRKIITLDVDKLKITYKEKIVSGWEVIGANILQEGVKEFTVTKQDNVMYLCIVDDAGRRCYGCIGVRN
ncbi:prepilin-type N-terminal cleavage/methylation domain-containing protein [Haloimpatiens sp. FM7330]|uniref:prepilin-type N-terminal cleavage/methylation domain-containing protein n=1 Tax=Haloimpatiens sp. FM7330 TaxID=3298610 RepID=UPI00363EAA13